MKYEQNRIVKKKCLSSMCHTNKKRVTTNFTCTRLIYFLNLKNRNKKPQFCCAEWLSSWPKVLC